MLYPDVLNPELIDRIPLSARTVLDVGCGGGALGAEYKRRNPRARYFGIELDPAAAQLASARLDAVAQVDVETAPLPFGDTLFDCILYGDVLEHLRDPWAVLGLHVRRLAPGGVVVICMPNAEHWSFVERLLRGTWNYEPLGLFDATHLRWFTPETTRRALGGAGLVACDVVARVFDRAAAERFAHAMSPALRALGIDPEAYLSRSAPLQHVWRACRMVPERLQVVSTMLPPVGGVSEVRVSEPMRALGAEPAVVTAIIEGFVAPERPSDIPGVFILHRPRLLGEQGLAQLRQAMAGGHLVICEFDDNPEYLAALQHPEVLNFTGVHAVQTTTPALAQVLRRYNPEVGIFPNAVARAPDVVNHANAGRQTLFFGGINRESEWPPYIAALNRAAAMAGERLHFSIVADRGLFDALETPHKSFTPLCDYETYRELLSRSEICFMPLSDTPFNRCKSDLKFIEAAALRVTALASPTVYADSIVDGENGVLFRSQDELTQRLLRLVANPEIGRAIGTTAREQVLRERMLADQVAARISWYRSLWARRAELQAALAARVPSLASIGPAA
ncbi:MAG: methyltransferase domain-containing protein [Rhodospirillales bacterium]|nr:methyltransferase domain-containing protein [Rhodospirillales bacterium]